jgi:hypothetical protein
MFDGSLNSSAKRLQDDVSEVDVDADFAAGLLE